MLKKQQTNLKVKYCVDLASNCKEKSFNRVKIIAGVNQFINFTILKLSKQRDGLQK